MKQRFKWCLMASGWMVASIVLPIAAETGGVANRAVADGTVPTEVGEIKAEIAALTGRANDALLSRWRGEVEGYLLGATELLRWREHLRPLTPLGPGFRKSGQDEKISIIEMTQMADSDPAAAVWEVDVQAEGTHQVEFRCTAGKPVTVLMFLNGARVAKHVVSQPSAEANWTIGGVFHFRSGRNVLRYETMEDRELPVIDKVVLIPTTFSLRPPAATTAPLRPPHVIARERGLIREVLENWTDYLAATDTGDHPVFAAWHELRAVPDDELACCAESVVRDYAGLGPEGTSLLTPLVEKVLIGFAPSSMSQVARKYGPMFAEADRAWQAYRNTPAGQGAESLPDANLEPFRQVLYDPAGPFALPVHPEEFYSPADRTRLNQLRAALAARAVQ